MTVARTGQKRLQYSLQSLLILTGVSAIVLAPVAWVTRERQQVIRAREEAIRAVVLAERAARENNARTILADSEKSGAALPQTASIGARRSDLVERLQRENAELKKTVQLLRQHVQRLKAGQEH